MILQKQEWQASWDALATAWRPDEDRGERAFGSGQPRIQIVQLRAFGRSAFWEVCQQEAGWVLYSSEVIDFYPLAVQGYQRVAIPSEKLSAYFEKLASISLPLAPLMNEGEGRDGVETRMTLLGDLSSEVRLQWWSKAPSRWSPVIHVVTEMLVVFGGPAAGE